MYQMKKMISLILFCCVGLPIIVIVIFLARYLYKKELEKKKLPKITIEQSIKNLADTSFKGPYKICTGVIDPEKIEELEKELKRLKEED